MASTKVAFSKITSTPTSAAWSQAYSAGNFAALIALSQKETQEEDLQTIGREIVTTLEAEYFTLENKNLSTVKIAVKEAVKDIPETITANIVVATVVNDTLYACLFGGGKIFIKRGYDTGLLLEKPALAIADANITKQVLGTSGNVKSNDIYILVSDTFLTIVTQEKLLDQIMPEKLEEVTENISLQLHEKKEGSASAILFTIKGEVSSQLFEPPNKPETVEITAKTLNSNNVDDEVVLPEPKTAISISSFIQNRRLLFGAIALIIIVIISANIFLSVKKKQQQAVHDQFEKVYALAQEKYNEGQNLLSLNKQEAKDDFLTVQSMLIPYQTKFPANSPEYAQLASLVTKTSDGLTAAKAENQASAKQATDSDSPLLAFENKQNAQYAAQDSTSIYLADTNGISAISKGDNKSKSIIKNSGDWAELGGLGTYLGNIYVLDRKGSIIKYAAGSYGKTDYFGSSKQDLSKANSIAIDGSIYIVYDDGSIKKFTKGQPDTFTISGLDKPLSHPSRIFTNADSNNVYILDNGNSRIVVFDKNGVYQSQYVSNNLMQAKDFDVSEKDKKIFILNQNKIWEIDIK